VLLMLKLKQLGEPLPRGAILMSPWVKLDPIDTPSWESNNYTDYISFSAVVKEAFTLSANGGRIDDPSINPYFASEQLLQGLPPMWISVGGAEILRSCIEDFAQRARGVGVPVELYVGEGMAHVYQMFACCVARPPTADLLPWACCCRLCCADMFLETPAKHPVWTSFESARRWELQLGDVQAVSKGSQFLCCSATRQ